MQCETCGCGCEEVVRDERPATKEEIADVIYAMSQIANDPNLTIISREHCYCDCHFAKKEIDASPAV